MLHMGEPRVSIWTEAPELAIPDVPALLCDSEDLWLAYRTTAEPRGPAAERRSVSQLEGEWR